MVNSALGRDIIDFYENGFPLGYYYEPGDSEIVLHDDDGNWLIDGAKRYQLSQIGPLIANDGGAGLGFTFAFNDWWDKQISVTITLRCPKSIGDAVKARIQALDPEIEVE